MSFSKQRTDGLMISTKNGDSDKTTVIGVKTADGIKGRIFDNTKTGG